MLLALDIGNSSITLGVFAPEGDTPLYRASLAVDTRRTADEYAVIMRNLLGETTRHITQAVIGSVVPQLTHTLDTAVAGLRSDGQTVPVLHIAGGVRTGVSLRVDDPSALGADIVTNAAAAVKLYGAPVVFFDYGTATVCGVVNQNRELIGVTIAPGLTASLEGLRATAAQIPYLELKAPEGVLGKNTAAAISAGLVTGTACMTDGMIDRIREVLHLPEGTPLPVVATGGLSSLILPACRRSIAWEPDLTLRGLCHIHRETTRQLARQATARQATARREAHAKKEG